MSQYDLSQCSMGQYDLSQCSMVAAWVKYDLSQCSMGQYQVYHAASLQPMLQFGKGTNPFFYSNESGNTTLIFLGLTVSELH